jgi:argininosuccinate lyase
MGDGMLWGARFERAPDAGMLGLTRSIGIDLQLLDADLRVTKAHARVLVKAGLIDQGALEEIDSACDGLAREAAAADLSARVEDEDVHSLVERELTERLGDVGARIHAGRSRNDLVVTDLRLWCKEAADTLQSAALELADALAGRAEEHTRTVMPGYTHLQRAQPVTLGFHLLAHAFAILRDAERFNGARRSADVSALGAGALAGTTLPLEPFVAASELGFERIFDNAMDAVSDRDFACELVFASALCGVHLSRLAEEIVFWTSAEFGFARLPDEWSTGSSMMPQKRNPDLAELVRGRSAAGIADLTGLMTLIKGVPLAYVRDLQEDKPFVLGAARRAARGLEGMTRLVESMRFDIERMAAAAGRSGTWATDVAEALVGRGVPFREAHAAVGRLISTLEGKRRDLYDADSEDLRAAHPLLDDADRVLADARAGVAARTSHGGSAPGEVVRQIETLRSAIVRQREGR